MDRAQPMMVRGLPEPISHYSDAVRYGNLAFVSGIVALNGDGSVVGLDDPVAQTEKIFENLGLVLDALGAAPSDVLKLTIFMRNIEDRPAINPVRQRFFGSHRPASTLVEVSALVHPDLLLEIEAVTSIPD